MGKFTIAFLVVTLITFGLIFNNTVSAEDCTEFEFIGKGYANFIDIEQGITQGSISFRSKDRKVRLKCGVRGVPYVTDEALKFKQIVVCDDHSRFDLVSEMTEYPDGSFYEHPEITVVEGPFYEEGYRAGEADVIGIMKVTETGGIWIDMKIKSAIIYK
ncbi:hypothetical protein [Desulfobacter curvatus]|uniref:hypothetical protein n=1 Tax=Desulfobacter curvatus TaxID=2290 RepID=UPI00037040C0|nr:hypothetical protein [Desulfobacter curvatus]